MYWLIHELNEWLYQAGFFIEMSVVLKTADERENKFISSLYENFELHFEDGSVTVEKFWIEDLKQRDKAYWNVYCFYPTFSPP